MKNLNIIKKISIAFLILLVLQATNYKLQTIEAATPTPQPSQNEIPQSEDLEKIQRIKDIVASKVAELNLIEKRGIIGSIKVVTNMQVTITDIQGKNRQIDVDELTKFNISKTASGISDLVKGTTYSFVGLYNKDTQKLLARNINITPSIPEYIEGAITTIDEKNYQIKIVNNKGEEKIIDIKTSTKTSLASDDGDLTRSGFSKLEANERILAIGFWDKSDPNMLAAIRVIHFANIPPTKEMQSHIKLED